MNVIKLVEEELKDKDWNIVAKVKYIYNRSCELFTYDSRYYYADYSFKRELKYKKIDLENVDDNRVVCSSHAREVCLPLLELIGMESKVIDEDSHGKLKVKLFEEDYIMDAAGNLDFMRVKLKRNTRGFYPIKRREGYADSIEMKKLDQRIHYIDEDYFKIENVIINNPNDSIVDKFHQIQLFLNQHPHIRSENDASKVINYLQMYLLTNSEFFHVSEQELFYDQYGNWDIKRIYTIEEYGKSTSFLLEEKNSKYIFEEITEEDAQRKINSHKGYSKKLLFL